MGNGQRGVIGPLDGALLKIAVLIGADALVAADKADAGAVSVAVVLLHHAQALRGLGEAAVGMHGGGQAPGVRIANRAVLVLGVNLSGRGGQGAVAVCVGGVGVAIVVHALGGAVGEDGHHAAAVIYGGDGAVLAHKVHAVAVPGVIRHRAVHVDIRHVLIPCPSPGGAVGGLTDVLFHLAQRGADGTGHFGGAAGTGDVGNDLVFVHNGLADGLGNAVAALGRRSVAGDGLLDGVFVHAAVFQHFRHVLLGGFVGTGKGVGKGEGKALLRLGERAGQHRAVVDVLAEGGTGGGQNGKAVLPQRLFILFRQCLVAVLQHGFSGGAHVLQRLTHTHDGEHLPHRGKLLLRAVAGDGDLVVLAVMVDDGPGRAHLQHSVDAGADHAAGLGHRAYHTGRGSRRHGDHQTRPGARRLQGGAHLHGGVGLIGDLLIVRPVQNGRSLLQLGVGVSGVRAQLLRQRADAPACGSLIVGVHNVLGPAGGGVVRRRMGGDHHRGHLPGQGVIAGPWAPRRRLPHVHRVLQRLRQLLHVGKQIHRLVQQLRKLLRLRLAHVVGVVVQKGVQIGPGGQIVSDGQGRRGVHHVLRLRGGGNGAFRAMDGLILAAAARHSRQQQRRRKGQGDNASFHRSLHRPPPPFPMPSSVCRACHWSAARIRPFSCRACRISSPPPAWATLS